MSTETRTYNPLLLGEGETDSGVLVSGQVLDAGALLGKITASGKLTLSLAAATDGSEVPYAILSEATDATSGDKVCPIILAGPVAEKNIIFGAGHTAESTKDTLRDLGIFLKTSK